MPRLEALVGGICSGAWLLAIVFLWFGAPELGRFPPPRSLFTFAAIWGWVVGNVYVTRRNAGVLPRRTLLAIYLGGPPGLTWLIWSLVPADVQAQAPLAPFLAVAIHAIFFFVPVTLRRRP